MPVTVERRSMSSGMRPTKWPMPQAGSSTRPPLKPNRPAALIHRADDSRRSVMGVQGGGAGGTVFLIGQNFRKLDLLLVPVRVVHVEHLGQPAPADIFDQHGFFLLGRRPFLGIERSQRLNRGKVPLKFLFRSAFAQPVGFGDAIIVEIFRRVFLLLAMFAFLPGGRPLGLFGREQDVFLPHHFPRLIVRLLCRCSPLHQLRSQRDHFVLRLFLRLQEHPLQQTFPSPVRAPFSDRCSRQCFSAIRPYWVNGVMGWPSR